MAFGSEYRCQAPSLAFWMNDPGRSYKRIKKENWRRRQGEEGEEGKDGWKEEEGNWTGNVGVQGDKATCTPSAWHTTGRRSISVWEIKQGPHTTLNSLKRAGQYTPSQHTGPSEKESTVHKDREQQHGNYLSKRAASRRPGMSSWLDGRSVSCQRKTKTKQKQKKLSQWCKKRGTRPSPLGSTWPRNSNRGKLWKNSLKFSDGPSRERRIGSTSPRESKNWLFFSF